jgi:hypothetical protein
MIEVNIELEEETKKYEFPESWDDVNVDKFIKIYQLRSDNSSTEIESSCKLLSAISGIDMDILFAMDIEDFKNLIFNLKFISTEVQKSDVDYIELEGDRYYLYSDFNKLTTGEVITIETLLEAASNDFYNIMPELLCLFLRKKKDGKYEKFTTDMLKRKEMFKQVPITQIYHIFNFFINGRSISKNNTKDYTSEPFQ